MLRKGRVCIFRSGVVGTTLNITLGWRISHSAVPTFCQRAWSQRRRRQEPGLLSDTPAIASGRNVLCWNDRVNGVLSMAPAEFSESFTGQIAISEKQDSTTEPIG